MHFSNMLEKEGIEITGYIVKAFCQLENYFLKIILLTSTSVKTEKNIIPISCIKKKIRLI